MKTKNYWKLSGLALSVGLLSFSMSTPAQAYYYYGGGYYGGFGPGFAIGAAAGIITAAAIANANRPYYGYPYYRTGYYGSPYYYGSCRQVWVKCYWQRDRYGYKYRQCYRYIRWVC